MNRAVQDYIGLQSYQDIKSYFLDCSGLFCGQQNCSNFFPETFLLGKKNNFNFNSNCPEKFFQLYGKIFPTVRKNFSGQFTHFSEFFYIQIFFFQYFFCFFQIWKKSPENPKKHSVDIIVLSTLRRNSFSCNFDFSKLPRLKKGHLVNIPKPRPSASASKIFYSLPFFQPR